MGTRNKTYHKHDEHKAQRTCKTDQSDHAEAAKYLRGAANVLLGRGEAQGQEERVSDDTRPSHTNNYAHHQKVQRKNSGGSRNAPE